MYRENRPNGDYRYLYPYNDTMLFCDDVCTNDYTYMCSRTTRDLMYKGISIAYRVTLSLPRCCSTLYAFIFLNFVNNCC